MVRNAPVMAKREVVFSGFSGILAFGVGVAVGANWPRASNFVGFILQRLGLELTDLALWMWDPEKSLVRPAETIPVKRAKAKKKSTPKLLVQNGLPGPKKVGARAKKSAGSSRNQPGQGVQRAAREKVANLNEPLIRSAGLNGSTPQGNGRHDKSLLMESGKPGNRAGRLKSTTVAVATTQAPTKPKRAMNNSKRKTPSSRRRGRKISTFAGAMLPADVALN
jgi:hypothetical protein